MGKCEVVHFSKKNEKVDSDLNGERLQMNEIHRDLGVFVHESLKLAGRTKKGKQHIGNYEVVGV